MLLFQLILGLELEDMASFISGLTKLLARSNSVFLAIRQRKDKPWNKGAAYAALLIRVGELDGLG